MPALTALVLNDKDSTAITFSPIGFDKNRVAKVSDTSAGVASIAPSVTMSTSGTKAANRSKHVISFPTTGTDDVGLPVKVGDNMVEVSTMANTQSSDDDRAQALAYLRSYVNSTHFEAVFLNGESIW